MGGLPNQGQSVIELGGGILPPPIICLLSSWNEHELVSGRDAN